MEVYLGSSCNVYVNIVPCFDPNSFFFFHFDTPIVSRSWKVKRKEFFLSYTHGQPVDKSFKKFRHTIYYFFHFLEGMNLPADIHDSNVDAT